MEQRPTYADATSSAVAAAAAPAVAREESEGDQQQIQESDTGTATPQPQHLPKDPAAEGDDSPPLAPPGGAATVTETVTVTATGSLGTTPEFVGPLHLHPPMGSGNSPPAKRFKTDEHPNGATAATTTETATATTVDAAIVDPESDGPSQAGGRGTASKSSVTGGNSSSVSALMMSSNPVTPVILTESPIDLVEVAMGGAVVGGGESGGGRHSHHDHGDTAQSTTQPLQQAAAAAATNTTTTTAATTTTTTATATSSRDKDYPRMYANEDEHDGDEENDDDEDGNDDYDEEENAEDEDEPWHSLPSAPPAADGGEGATTPTGLIASKVPTTPVGMVERRQSNEGSTSPSDLSSSSRGGADAFGRDGRGGGDDGAISPLTATYFLPDVPPAPPSTPASEFTTTSMMMMAGSSGRFAGLAAAMTPLPIYAPNAVQNAYLLEQQQLLAEGAVTPAPTITRRASSSSNNSNNNNNEEPHPPARQRPNQSYPPPEPPTPQPSNSAAGGRADGRGGAAAAAGTGTARPPAPLSDDFSEWAVSERYKLLRILGRGSYGEVAQALDLQQGRPDAYVAIKRIQSPFDQEVDAVRLFREIHILRRLRGHECIIQLLDVIQPPTDDLDDFHDLYLVFECKCGCCCVCTMDSLVGGWSGVEGKRAGSHPQSLLFYTRSMNAFFHLLHLFV
jgi:hypothetical protein